MVVIILAAGYATRLYPLTKDKPKALLPIGSRPLMDHLMDKVRPLNPASIVLVTNDRFEKQFKDWAAGHPMGNKIRVLNDGTTSNDNRLGAIGDLQFAIDRAKVDGDIIVLASDNLFDGDLAGFARFAASKKDAAAIGVFKLADPQDGSKKYGMVETDPESRILKIEEKPEKPRTPYASMGIYWFPKSSMKYITEYLGSTQKQDAPGYYATWLLDRIKLYAFQFPGRWYDIGSLEQLQEASTNYETRK